MTTVLLLLGLLVVAPPSHAHDTADLRGYLNVRLGISAAYDTDVGGDLSATPNEQVLGISVGVNLGRYLSLERWKASASATPSSMTASDPASASTSAAPHGVWSARSASAPSTFVANNIALGLEAKYIISRDQDIRVNGRQQSLDLDTLLATAGIRLYFPEVKGR